MLSWSRDAKEVTSIVAQRRYWSEYTRQRVSKEASTAVTIVSGRLGKQLLISNEYAHTACHYLKFYLVDLCKSLQSALLGKCTIGLPSAPHYIDLPKVPKDRLVDGSSRISGSRTHRGGSGGHR